MSKQTKFYENLANMISSTAFYVHLPNRERGKGQRLSDVTLSLLLSVLYIFVTSLTDVSGLFHIGPFDIVTIIMLLCVSSCQMQICANCPQVL